MFFSTAVRSAADTKVSTPTTWRTASLASWLAMSVDGMPRGDERSFCTRDSEMARRFFVADTVLVMSRRVRATAVRAAGCAFGRALGISGREGGGGGRNVCGGGVGRGDWVSDGGQGSAKA